MGIARETEANRKWAETQFQKLPIELQLVIAQHRDVYPQLFTLEPKGDEKLKKVRYGVVGIHDGDLYIGNITPIGKDKARIRLRKELDL